MLFLASDVAVIECNLVSCSKANGVDRGRERGNERERKNERMRAIEEKCQVKWKHSSRLEKSRVRGGG